MTYRDRADAGRRLGAALGHLAPQHPIIVALPRGGVAVGAEVAHQLHAPLEVIVVRKLGVPTQPELAMGAIGQDIVVVNHDVLRSLGLGLDTFVAVQQAEQVELERRVAIYHGDRPRLALAGRAVIVVDDGVATGSTARAACQVVRASGAQRIVLAVPVGPTDVEASFTTVVDEIVCLERPAHFFSIGESYLDFSPLTDAAVLALLADASRA